MEIERYKNEARMSSDKVRYAEESAKNGQRSITEF